MCEILIVANNERLTRCIAKAMPDDADRKIFSLAEAELEFARHDFLPPDLLIVDLEYTDQPTKRFLANLSHSHPETTVIVIVPAENPYAIEVLTPFGVDEFIVRQAGEVQRRGMIEHILRRISEFDRLLMVQEKLRLEMRQSQIIAKSKAMQKIMHRLPQLAASKSTVLITGETGAGKELVARAIHYLGPRNGQPFIIVDCGTLPDHLVENELFGHARGAYTGAGAPFKGMIQEADGGTLFLDEVEALPLAVQSKFLRFLQDREYKPLGQSKYVSVDVRVLAASNIDLAQAVEKRLFRKDLYYRLNVVPLFIPPLRERMADIPALAHSFLKRYSRDQQLSPSVSEEVLRSWMAYDWPGNVRELENKVQQWLTVSSTDKTREVTPLYGPAEKGIRKFAEARRDVVAQFERKYLQNLLRHAKGNISAAARLAGIDRKYVRELLKKHSIDVHRV